MLRFASARMPVSKERLPSLIAASMSSVPTTRSSVALTGSSTTFIGSSSTGGSALSYFSWHSSHQFDLSAGSSWKRQPWMHWRGGRRSASARTAVDFAVPFSPWIKTPPSRGLTTFSTSAFFMSSCPIMAVNGNVPCRFIMCCPPFVVFIRPRRLPVLPQSRGKAPVISLSFRRRRSTSASAPLRAAFQRCSGAPTG